MVLKFVTKIKKPTKPESKKTPILKVGQQVTFKISVRVNQRQVSGLELALSTSHTVAKFLGQRVRLNSTLRRGLLLTGVPTITPTTRERGVFTWKPTPWVGRGMCTLAVGSEMGGVRGVRPTERQQVTGRITGIGKRPKDKNITLDPVDVRTFFKRKSRQQEKIKKPSTIVSAAIGRPARFKTSASAIVYLKKNLTYIREAIRKAGATVTIREDGNLRIEIVKKEQL